MLRLCAYVRLQLKSFAVAQNVTDVFQLFIKCKRIEIIFMWEFFLVAGIRCSVLGSGSPRGSVSAAGPSATAHGGPNEIYRFATGRWPPS